MSEKQKLTLSVNKEVVEKAKELGINISEITENVLRGFAFTPEGLDDEVIYQQYNELFTVMQPLMKKYGFHLEVAIDPQFDEHGEHMYNETYTLSPDLLLWVEPYEHIGNEIKAIQVTAFHSPLQILESFLTKLTTAVGERREHIREIEMAKRIVQAITGTLEEKDDG